MVNTLSNDEVDKLLQVLLNPITGKPPNRLEVRDYALAVIMLDAGLRIGELVQLRVSDLVFQGETVNVLTVRAETAKRHLAREIPVSVRLCATVEILKGRYWYYQPYLTDHFAFYVGDKESHLGRRQVERIITAAGWSALGRKITPHTLRHTFGTRVLRKSNIRIAQQLLGHKSITSTQIYTHPNSDERKAAIDAISIDA